jgi:hypothetical protein
MQVVAREARLAAHARDHVSSNNDTAMDAYQAWNSHVSQIGAPLRQTSSLDAPRPPLLPLLTNADVSYALAAEVLLEHVTQVRGNGRWAHESNNQSGSKGSFV